MNLSNEFSDPIRAIIIDDESSAVRLIQKMIKELALNIDVVDIAMNGLEAIKKIAEYKPELIFLDVEMPIISGIDVLEKFPDREFEIIFTTGSSEYVLKALKLKAIDYLLKPINPADLIVAVANVKDKISMHKQIKETVAPQRIQVTALNEILFLDPNDIISISGSGSYCQLNMKDKRVITISKNIGQVEETLQAFGYFFRCHQSFIININYISKVLNKEHVKLEMKDGKVITVSRRNKPRFMQLVKHL